jgi:pyrimidine-specific ribonucleoside hydrolase
VAAHEQTAPVIVDADLALDDARALALLLNAPDVAIRAVVTSDGACPPDVGATNVLRVLKYFGREEIPVGAGRKLGQPAPAWAERSVALGWSDLPVSTRTSGNASAVLAVAFAGDTNRFTWIALGPLSNLADLLRAQPEVKARIARVLYCGGAPEAARPGWNTQRDPEAARAVFASGLEIVPVQLPDERTLVVDASLLAEIRRIDSPAARLFTRLHEHAELQPLIAAGHFRAWDETVVLAFFQPWFGPGAAAGVQSLDCDFVRTAYLKALAAPAGGVGERTLVTLREFPLDPAQYQPDLQPLVWDIIARHGVEEWKLNVLTSELHRHLGLYSILGAKMGLRARELFGASLDELHVESQAGLRPPVSCLNDGLQTATGASLGRGTIRVPETNAPQAAAVFTFNGRKLQMRVRTEAVRKIQAQLREAVQKHGDLTPAYFAAVRRISLEAWRDLDRHEIFEETLSPAGSGSE